MPELRWRQTARDDLRSIIEYIAADNPAAALALWETIEARIGHLPEFPKAHRPGRLPGTRELIAHQNYIVVYSESPDSIEILRVLHGAQMWP
ncbi:type II toxin-antitoxin system RelE/ParE family toxin [Paracoccus sp. IB05]|uniref:type II toxin-antitoxin system RelE/ParE family toxin n=1 Tax=Paracoccus sp. IB05 TaxID=2779367 RepID=UPI0018E89F42|nr:type II toxin-antitoxin system RelE/ParE family toxin [Paracoccus sp. IB05]